MTPERAHEINSAMVAHSMFNMGLREEAPPSLAGFTLRDMLDATEQVAREDDAKPCPKKIRMVCDPRLVAALYVLAHYPAQDADGNIETIAADGKAGVVVVKLEKVNA